MDYSWQARTEILVGEERMALIRKAHVLVVGVGGVGAYAAEMLCRAGVGRLTLVDADTIGLTNINRQLPALHSTVGEAKVTLLRNRFLDINPDAEIKVGQVFLDETNVDEYLDGGHYDFVVDAIDTVSSKCRLIEACLDRNVPIVSAMGAGARRDIRRIKVDGIWKTAQCALAKTVRASLRRDGYGGCRLPVVYSDEPMCRDAVVPVENERGKRSTTGTVSYMAATFGNYLAWYVLEHL